MSVIIEMPFAISDLDKVFEVCDLLDNKEELIKQFRPEVAKYVVKESFFKGRALQEYHRQFDELICSLIKREIMKHHMDYTPEELMLLTDVDFLKMITHEFYFNQNNYLITKDGKNGTTN